MKTNKQK